MSNNYQHIHKQFRHVLSCSKKDRLEFLSESRWIGCPKTQKIIDNLQGLMNRIKRPRMPNLLLIGDSNSGKTTLIKHFNKKFGVPYLNDNIDAVIPVVTIQFVQSVCEKELYIKLLEFLALPYNPEKTVIDLRYQVLDSFRELNVNMLIIDRIDFLATEPVKQQKQMMNTIRLICNDLEIPFVAVGGKNSIKVVSTSPGYVDRFSVFEMPKWSNDSDFKKLLNSFESFLPLKEVSNLDSPKLADLIYKISEGHIGNIHSLLTQCTTDALNNGEESITLHNIESKLEKCI